MELSNNEVKVLRIMWSAKRALSRREILSLNSDMSWDTRTIHALLNSMMAKGAVREAGHVKYGKNQGRLYEAVITCEDFFLSVLAPVKDIMNYGLFIGAIINNKAVDESTIEQIKLEIEGH